MYMQCSCLYRYSAYIFNIGTYSDSYTSLGATLVISTQKRCKPAKRTEITALKMWSCTCFACGLTLSLLIYHTLNAKVSVVQESMLTHL